MVVQENVMSVGTKLDETAVQAFIAGVRGEVLRPNDDGYDAARAVQNGLIDRRPMLIVRCTGVADVVAAVNFARDNNLLLSIKGGGHNVSGNAVADGGVMIDLSLMNGVYVDRTARTVRAGGGATWGDVDRETQLFGYATTGGVVSTTGVGGLTLHGGMGHLRRKYGLSIDNLLSVDIVTADGQVRTANASENEDLFWAVRGAGSNFGVVTSLEFRLHEVEPMLMLCAPAYAAEDGRQVLAGWRDFMATAPEEISSIALTWSVPAVPDFPVELHNKPIVIVAAVHSGSDEEGARAMQPLRELATPVLDLSHPTTYTALQSGFDPFFPKGGLYYWKSLNLNRLEETEIGEILRHSAERPSPLSTVTIWHQGGAMSRVGAGETAFGQRDMPYLLSVESSWTEPTETERNIAWAREAWSSLRRFSDGGLYLNFAGFGEEKEALVRGAYGQNYDRLVELKNQYDPTNLFRLNQNISPSV